MVSSANLSFIRENDVMLASYPRSGNTWAMNMLLFSDILVLEGYRHDLSSIERIGDIPESQYGLLPGLTYSKTRNLSKKFAYRVIKTHSLPLQSFKKAIYIYRDGRDAVLSYYHYFRRFHQFSGTFLEFLNSAEMPARSWAGHINAWMSAKEWFPVHYVRYEDLCSSTHSELKKMLHFLGEDRTNSDIFQAIQNADFSKLKASEQAKNGVFESDQDLHFFRRGKPGLWRKEYKDEHIEIFRNEAKDALHMLGYEAF